MALRAHPLRSQLVNEMHLRRTPALAPPLSIVQTVRIVGEELRAAEHAHIMAMPGVATVDEQPRNINGFAASGSEIIWERQSEASTTTIVARRCADASFEPDIPDEIAWLEAAPGEIIRATKIAIFDDEDRARSAVEAMSFTPMDVVSCHIGAARIWSDFKLRTDGYGRLIVLGGGTAPTDLGRIVQRVQELGNYRNLALLGLPLAQSETGRLAALERRLEQITGEVSQADAGSEAILLDDLCNLAATVAAISTATGFRMSATRAYAQIVQDRLTSLRPVEIAGFQSLTDFTERRMLPAIRTCASFEQRLEALSIRIERTTSLLRTKVDLAMQVSNVELLRSMDANAARQLKLQHLVEGLSVIAVSYYAFSLLAKMFPPIERWSGLSEDWLQSALVLPVIIAVFIFLRWRARDLDEHP